MERQAEINRFAIFLFCLLVPLGSSAPTDISKEGKITTGQMEKRFPTEIKPLVSVIENKATELFKHYNNCISRTLHSETRLLNKSKVIDMVRKIPDCPAFRDNCCALHHIHSILQTVKSDVEMMCNASSDDISASIKQLDTTLREGDAFYTCRDQDLPQALSSQIQTMDFAVKMTYIWWVLKKYEQIMQNTRKMYSKAAI